MPGNKAPAEFCLYDETFPTYEETLCKSDTLSSRASSPKAESTYWSSTSESSESPEGSIISDMENEAERIANELDNMKITEIQAEEMMKEGADMRHVLQTAYKLKPKIGKKYKKGTKLSGQAVMTLLNFESYDEKAAEIDQKQRMARAWAQYERSLNKKGTWRPPPGFETLDDIIAKKINEEPGMPEYMVAYANGTNTLSLASDPMTLHDITVSCVSDTCRVFLQQMKNPTYVGLKNLEDELMTTYNLEPEKSLLRPIAQGSVLAVHSDDKWYRCQVVSYKSEDDTCEIKFVDHGGYTTVPASDLRQLKQDFLRLPFQAVEVYLAHVEPAKEEVHKDITAEVLFHGNISVQLMGMADDGIPMIQAYYYDGDYAELFSQEVINTCMVSVDTAKVVQSLQISEQQQTEIAILTETSQPINPTQVAPNNPTILPAPMSTEGYCHQPFVALANANRHIVPQVQQPFAYLYTDPNGFQQVYYLAAPLYYPTGPVMPQVSTGTPSELSFGSFDAEEFQSLTSGSASGSEAGDDTYKQLPSVPKQEDYENYYARFMVSQ